MPTLALPSEYVVFGGSGEIGKSVCERLLSAGNIVTSVARGIRDTSRTGTRTVGNEITDNFRKLNCNVVDTGDLTLFRVREFVRRPALSGIVYCVGYCPPGGFDEEVATPLAELGPFDLACHFYRHVSGLANVVKHFHCHLAPGSSIVVIGSAINRLTNDACPDWLHAGAYATAKAAQKELVTWLRRDPYVRRNRTLIHLISPGAVNTLFHKGAKRKPPTMLEIQEVVTEIVNALSAKNVIDKTLTAKPSVKGRSS